MHSLQTHLSTLYLTTMIKARITKKGKGEWFVAFMSAEDKQNALDQIGKLDIVSDIVSYNDNTIEILSYAAYKKIVVERCILSKSQN